MKHMKKLDEKQRAILFVVIMIAVLFAFAASMMLIGRYLPDAPLQDSFLENTKEDDFARREVLQTIKLDKKKYNIYHKFKTYLFMGTDASGNENAEGDAYQGSMADFLLLVVFDQTDKTYGFLQFNRDTMTEIPMMQSDGTAYASAEQQLCTAHWYGGDKKQSAENTVHTVSKLLGGIRIDGYYVISMSEIPNLNHYIGGVEVTLEEDFTKFDSTMTKGKTLKLTDEQAEIYLHNRYGVGDETNASRMKRQKQYMDSLFTAIKAKTSADANFGTKMFRDFKEKVTSDITMKQVARIGNDLKNGTSMGVLTIQGEDKEGKALGDNLVHAEYYLDATSLVETMTKLYQIEEAE